MRKFLSLLVIIFIVLVLFLLYEFYFSYHISLIGEKEVYINVNNSYKDPGVVVKYRGKTINNYKVKGMVDTSKIGKYTVEYEIKNTSKKRIVNVVDRQKPVIILNGGNNIKIPYMSEYKELGYSASDNYDGDITDKIIVKNNVDTSKLGEYTVEYIAWDSFGNENNIIRYVKVTDDENPKINLKRKKHFYAIRGKKINLDDVSATDNYDGDITDKIISSGEVDFNKIGKYNIEYSVTDSNGNNTILNSTINVQDKNTKGIPVLMYHWFYDDTKGEMPGKVNSHNYIAKTQFESQLKFLVENNYYYPSWQELIDYIDGKIDLPQKSVILTDDDCVDSFFKIALPLAQQYQVPITSFCITKKSNWQKYVNEEYLDFQSHTDSLHVRKCDSKWDGAVMCTAYDEIYKDIKLSVDKIKNIDAFAYPFGHYNDDVIKALKENNIKLAFTTNSGRVKRKMNKYKLPRVRISNSTTIKKYEKLLK